ncbi:hypothetical protein TNCV_1645081 [Trichonephila clavipes]|nr:hypothetical protein TNCV_1645081 [Trichonephila clavipes]
MTGTLPPLLDSVVGGGTPERSCVARLWIQCCCARKSPFAIQKALISIEGEPKSLKRLRMGEFVSCAIKPQNHSLTHSEAFTFWGSSYRNYTGVQKLRTRRFFQYNSVQKLSKSTHLIP